MHTPLGATEKMNRSKWPNEIMQLQKGLNYVWGLCCSLSSGPAVRRTGQPNAKRGEKHIQSVSSHELSHYFTTELIILLHKIPQPSGQLPLTRE